MNGCSVCVWMLCMCMDVVYVYGCCVCEGMDVVYVKVWMLCM